MCCLKRNFLKRFSIKISLTWCKIAHLKIKFFNIEVRVLSIISTIHKSIVVQVTFVWSKKLRLAVESSSKNRTDLSINLCITRILMKSIADGIVCQTLSCVSVTKVIASCWILFRPFLCLDLSFRHRLLMPFVQSNVSGPEHV